MLPLREGGIDGQTEEGGASLPGAGVSAAPAYSSPLAKVNW